MGKNFAISGESPLTMRAQCGVYRFYPDPLGDENAVVFHCEAISRNLKNIEDWRKAVLSASLLYQ